MSRNAPDSTSLALALARFTSTTTGALVCAPRTEKISGGRSPAVNTVSSTLPLRTVSVMLQWQSSSSWAQAMASSNTPPARQAAAHQPQCMLHHGDDLHHTQRCCAICMASHMRKAASQRLPQPASGLARPHLGCCAGPAHSHPRRRSRPGAVHGLVLVWSHWQSSAYART